MLIDTHCHIHESNYPSDPADTLRRAHEAGISDIIVVGTSEQSSQEAITFAARHEHVYASVGVHPHDTKDGYQSIHTISPAEFIAVGEIGLDYFYTHSPKELQQRALADQLQFAADHDKPVIFHVREAFADFWPIFDSFSSLRGVLHSFTDTAANLEEALHRGLYIGVNGISTFTKDVLQQEMFDQIPLDRMLFETDAPFLTPKPFRGSINEPAFVRLVAQYHADRRELPLEEIAAMSSANARELFAF
jgi:TatD DNase family protein